MKSLFLAVIILLPLMHNAQGIQLGFGVGKSVYWVIWMHLNFQVISTIMEVQPFKCLENTITKEDLALRQVFCLVNWKGDDANSSQQMAKRA